jgi:phospholipid N-methyltransferase
MKEHFQFLHGFFKNPLKVGAISPSSPALARKMVEDVRANEDNVVLEIGCGTGAITKFIRDLVPTRDSYLGIEIDHEFVCQLNRDFPTMQIVAKMPAMPRNCLQINNLAVWDTSFQDYHLWFCRKKSAMES